MNIIITRNFWFISANFCPKSFFYIPFGMFFRVSSVCSVVYKFVKFVFCKMQNSCKFVFIRVQKNSCYS